MLNINQICWSQYILRFKIKVFPLNTCFIFIIWQTGNSLKSVYGWVTTKSCEPSTVKAVKPVHLCRLSHPLTNKTVFSCKKITFFSLGTLLGEQVQEKSVFSLVSLGQKLNVCVMSIIIVSRMTCFRKCLQLTTTYSNRYLSSAARIVVVLLSSLASLLKLKWTKTSCPWLGAKLMVWRASLACAASAASASSFALSSYKIHLHT